MYNTKYEQHSYRNNKQMNKYHKEKENKMRTIKSTINVNMIMDSYTIRMQMHMNGSFCAPYIT
jgi:hypothetical protein